MWWLIAWLVILAIVVLALWCNGRDYSDEYDEFDFKPRDKDADKP